MDQRSDLNNEHYKEQYEKAERMQKVFSLFKLKIVLYAAAVLFILAFAVGLAKKVGSITGEDISSAVAGSEGVVSTTTASELEKVLLESKLYTAEYPYNGYVAVPNRDDPKYYAAYEGNVKASIDVSKIEVEVDDANHKVTVTLPDVTIEPPTVNASTMEYIFMDKSAETETVAHEAYRYALDDLAKRTDKDEELKAAAVSSAKTITEQLIKPWVTDAETGESYSIEIGYLREETTE